MHTAEEVEAADARQNCDVSKCSIGDVPQSGQIEGFQFFEFEELREAGICEFRRDVIAASQIQRRQVRQLGDVLKADIGNSVAPAEIEECDVGKAGDVLEPQIRNSAASGEIERSDAGALGEVLDASIHELAALREIQHSDVGEFRDVLEDDGGDLPASGQIEGNDPAKAGEMQDASIRDGGAAGEIEGRDVGEFGDELEAGIRDQVAAGEIKDGEGSERRHVSKNFVVGAGAFVQFQPGKMNSGLGDEFHCCNGDCIVDHAQRLQVSPRSAANEERWCRTIQRERSQLQRKIFRSNNSADEVRDGLSDFWRRMLRNFDVERRSELHREAR